MSKPRIPGPVRDLTSQLVFVGTLRLYNSPLPFFPANQALSWISDSCLRKVTLLAVPSFLGSGHGQAQAVSLFLGQGRACPW